MHFTYTLNAIDQAAEELWKNVKGKKVLAFNGPMGAGKTSFISALCRLLGVKSSVSSPTYSIINQYQSDKVGIIYHMDLYRLKDEAEAIQTGVEDALYSGDLCLVEWPQKAAGLLPDDTVFINIDLADVDSRIISTGN